MQAVSYLENVDLSSKEIKIKILLILIVSKAISYLEEGASGFTEKEAGLASKERLASIETASVLWLF